jgi:hypothetical protein
VDRDSASGSAAWSATGCQAGAPRWDMNAEFDEPRTFGRLADRIAAAGGRGGSLTALLAALLSSIAYAARPAGFDP